MSWLNNRLPERRFLLAGLAALALVWIFSCTRHYDWLETKLLDFRFQYRRPVPLADLITHIDIDNNSLGAIGRWPWPRTKHAELLEVLSDLNAGAVVFDVDFFEHTDKTFPGPETLADAVSTGLVNLYNNPPAKGTPETEYKQQVSGIAQGIYDDIIRTSDVDAKFSGALKAVGNAFLAMDFPAQPPQVQDTAPADGFSLPADTKGPLFFPRQAHIQLPVIKNARGLGFVGVEPDSDGILRRVQLFKAYQGRLYPQLALRVACEFFHISPDEINIRPNGLIGLGPKMPALRLPIDNQGRMLINWTGNSKTAWPDLFDHVPYSFITEEVLANRDKDPALYESNLAKLAPKIKDKICLVGMVATGSTDMKPTPVDPLLPGVMLHSNILNMILTDSFIYRVSWPANLAVLLVSGLLVILLSSKLNPFMAGGSTVVVIAAIFGLGFWLFSSYGLWLDLAGPGLAGACGFIVITAYRTVAEEQAKRRVRDTFGRYVAPQVVNELLKHPDKLKLGGEKKTLTVFFSDMANFTKSTADLDPDRMLGFVNRYLSEMAPIIQRYEGLIDKYAGDAIMALFGAPIENPEHAGLACRAALDNIRRLDELNREFQASGLPAIDIRIGLNTGEMVVGNVGSEKAMNYTVFGDEVILASRLEGINKFYQTRILISENTYRQAKGLIEARELDQIRAKGMKRPVRIYEVLAHKGGLSETLRRSVDCYAQALELYRQRKWDSAMAILEECLKENKDDGPSLNLLRRCKSFKQIPPPADWDTVYNLLTK